MKRQRTIGLANSGPKPSKMSRPDGAKRDVWPLVLSYLNRKDLGNLQDTSRGLRGLIRNSLRNDMILTIDKVSTASNKGVQLMTLATRIRIQGIDSELLKTTLSSLPNHLKSLTVADTDLDFEIPCQLPCLTGLTLVNVNIRRSLLENYISTFKGLTSLCLDGVSTHAGGVLRVNFSYEDPVNLTHLKIKCKSPSESRYNSLKVVSDCKHVIRGLDGLPLESVYMLGIDSGSISEQLRYTDLKSHTIHNWRGMEEYWFYPWNHLRAVDPRFGHSLNRRCPTEANLILNMLNGDCFLKIAEFLPPSDRLAFGHSHPRIGEEIFQHVFKSLDMRRIPEKFRKLVGAVLPFVRELSIESHWESGFDWIRKCSNIQSLAIWNCNYMYWSNYCESWPTKLSKFDYNEDKLFQEEEDLVMECFYGHLDRFFNKLEGLDEVRIKCSSVSPEVLSNCLQRNKETLKCFRFIIDTDRVVKKSKFWRMVSSLPQLTELELTFVEEWLFRDSNFHEIFTVVGGRLEKLTLDMCGNPWTFPATSFPRLQELVLLNWKWDQKYWDAPQTLKKLKISAHERTKEISVLDEDLVLLVEKLPALEELALHDYIVSTDIMRPLGKYLETNGRTLRITITETEREDDDYDFYYNSW